MIKSLKVKTHFLYTEKGAEKKNNNSELDVMSMRILKTLNQEYRKEYVYTQASLFNELFNKKVSDCADDKRLLKITNPKTKKSVWRIWSAISTDELGAGVQVKDILYANKETKFILTGTTEDSSTEEAVELKFKQCSVFSYYLHCSDRFNKSSYQIALFSLILGIISLFLGVVSLFCTFKCD